jgi:transposase
MERFIGLDVHASSSTFAVVGPSGKRIRSQVVETSGPALVGFLKAQKGQVHLCLEEGTQSSWLYEILSPQVTELVVVRVNQKKRKGPKNDERDAFDLADQIRLGSFEGSVFKELAGVGTLRQLVKVHIQVVRDVTRVCNRIKAVYRSRGVGTPDKTVYGQKHRDRYLEQLPRSSREALAHLYAQYDALLPVRADAEQALVGEARRHAITLLLKTCPGMGEIRVAQLLATVVSPHRFRTRQQFWSYCGLGVVMRSSADWVQQLDGRWQRETVQATRGLNRNHNRLLKCVFKGAATTVLGRSAAGDSLRQSYIKLTQAGTKPNLAKLTLARKLAATILAMWKNRQRYDPKHLAA